MAFKTSQASSFVPAKAKASERKASTQKAERPSRPSYKLCIRDESGATYVNLWERQTKNNNSPFYVGNTSVKKDDGTYENGEESFFFMPRQDGGSIKFRQAKEAPLETIGNVRPSNRNEGGFFGKSDDGKLSIYIDVWTPRTTDSSSNGGETV